MTDPMRTMDNVAGPRSSGSFGVSAPAAPAASAASQAASPDAERPPAQDLQAAMQELGQRFRDAGVDVTFSIDRELDRVIVKVVSSKDGSVLRQIPSEDVLRLARAMSDPRNALLQETA